MSTYPSINDREFDLLKKIATNTAELADTDAGDVSSIVAGTGITVSGATGNVTVSADVQASLDAISSTQGSLLYRNAADWVALAPGVLGQFLQTQGAAANPQWSTPAGSGDFVGPASSTDNAILRFDGTGGKTGQNSAVTIADTTGDIAGASSLTAPTSTDLTLSGGSTGASLVLGQGTSANAVVNVLSSSPADPQSNAFRVAVGTNQLNLGNNTTGNGYSFIQSVKTGAAWTPLVLQAGAGGNVLIGTTTDMTGSGGLKVASTSGSSGSTSGAIITPGGGYFGAASVFGSTVTAASGMFVPSDQVFFQGVSSSTGTFRRLGQGLSTLHLGSYGGASFANVSNGASGVLVELIKTRGTAVGDFAVAQNGDELGAINWRVGNGTSLSDCSLISAYVDGTPSGANVPTNLIFKVRPNTGAAETALTLAATKAATFAGTVIAPAATASLAPLRIPHGTAPTSPTDGDMWTTTAGLFIRINGATVGPLS